MERSTGQPRTSAKTLVLFPLRTLSSKRLEISLSYKDAETSMSVFYHKNTIKLNNDCHWCEEVSHVIAWHDPWRNYTFLGVQSEDIFLRHTTGSWKSQMLLGSTTEGQASPWCLNHNLEDGVTEKSSLKIVMRKLNPPLNLTFLKNK